MLRNLVMNLIAHGRIRTTVQKAKAARPLAEKLITLGKKGALRHRQLALSTLGSTVAARAAVRKLFGELRDRFASRNGGYTRILHLPRTIRQAKVDLPRSQGTPRSKIYGTRLGDNADLVLWELCEAQISKPERKKLKVRSKKPKPKKAPKTEEAKPAEQAPAAPAGEAAPAAAPAEAPQAAAPAETPPTASSPAAQTEAKPEAK
jgi:large subunit ribosomal protein L17